MHVVVTGASGNVGTALLRALAVEHPEWRVTGVARRPPPRGTAPYDVADWVSLDLSDPGVAPALREAMGGADAVVHLAWAIQPTHDPAYLDAVNLDGSRRVVQAARSAGVTHLVVASSVGAYTAAPEKPRVDESWPTSGVPSSGYSRQKAAVERMLDAVEEGDPGFAVARLRPGLVLQSAAGSEISRYFIGSLLGHAPALLRRVRPPLVPLPRFTAPAVHADDVAQGTVAILERRARGAFNLAADDDLTSAVVASALGGRALPVPALLARIAVEVSWRARLQPTDGGWLDLALAVPLLDSGRARRELGWAPTRSAEEAVRELVEGMAEGRGTASPALAPRQPVGGLLPGRARPGP